VSADNRDDLYMTELLDKFLADAPEADQGSFAAQIQYKNGQVVAGQISRGPMPGIYRLTAPTQQGMMAALYFPASAVFYLSTPLPQAAILTPDKKLVVPKAH